MKAKIFQHLLNGGGKEAGISGLQSEIDTIQTAMADHRRTLATFPERRAALLLGDNPDDELDQLELAERAAYRRLERGTMQIGALETRIGEMRRAAIKPLIDRHRAALMAAAQKVESSLRLALQANAEAANAYAEAVEEIGENETHMLLPIVEYAGMLDERCLEAWHWRLNDQNERIDRQHGSRQ